MIPAPRVLDDWRKAIDVRPENALILAPVTCQDARELLAYVAALQKEYMRVSAEFARAMDTMDNLINQMEHAQLIGLIDAEADDETTVSWTDEYTERFGE